MTIEARELRVLRILAALRGHYLALDTYGEVIGQKTGFPLSKREFWELARELEKKGLVASVLERLDGLLIALTVSGRKLMEAEGAQFDVKDLEKTRRVFASWRCEAEM